MKTFTKYLTFLCLTCSVASSSVFAGLITESLTEPPTVNESGFSFFYPNSTPTLTSNSVIRNTDSANISWLTDISNLVTIDFNMKLLGDYGLASLYLGDALLWSSDVKTENLTAIRIGMSNFDFDSFDSSMQSLSFGIQSTNFDQPYVRVGRDDKVSFQLSNIRLARTEVPEPSTLVLLLLPLFFMTRKQLVKS